MVLKILKDMWRLDMDLHMIKLKYFILLISPYGFCKNSKPFPNFG
jgi:hypothetical protein